MSQGTRGRLCAAIAAGALLLPACQTPLPEPVDFPSTIRAEPLAEPAPQQQAEPEAPSPPPPAPEPLEPDEAPRPAIGDETLYAFEFRDTPIADALRMIADRAALNFVVPAGTAGSISASLPSVTLDQAAGIVLREGNIDLLKESGVFFVRPHETPALVNRVLRPTSIDITEVEAQIRGILGGEAGGFTVNKMSNVIYLSAPPDKVKLIEDLVQAMDASPREVLIEARIVEVALDEGYEFGVALDLQDITAAATSSQFLTDFLRPADNFQLITRGDHEDMESTLQALQRFGKLRVIANPRVLALNHELAKIEIIERVPYIEATATTTGASDGSGVGTSTVEQVEFEEVGIRLHVTPVLGEGDSVTLKIMQEVSEVVEYFHEVPVTDQRTVDTRFVVNDRETIVIGGLLKERARETEDGIPYLMHIPFLGNLFKGMDKTYEKVELLIFITPRIVREGEVAGISSEYKRELIRKTEEYRQQYQEFLEDVK
ncbi:MAG: hypothetical protein HY812_22455 [Planctomycetes bacterium]|nr:hypothetical protein [Planctomycetota bacterium]